MKKKAKGTKAAVRKSPPQGGRPSKFTPAVCAIILESVRAGQSYAMSCRRARIDDSTLSHWAAEVEEKGEASRYFQFINDLMQAEADGQLALIATVRTATKQDWKAAAWLLERKHPDEWGRRDSLSLGRSGGEDDPEENVGGVLLVPLPLKASLPPLPATAPPKKK